MTDMTVPLQVQLFFPHRYLLGISYVGVSVSAIDNTAATVIETAIQEHCHVS